MLLNCGVGETLESPLYCKAMQPAILKEISPEYPLKDWCWSWNSNTLATWCKETDSLEKTLTLGRIEGSWRRGRWRIRWLDCIVNSLDMSLRKVPEVGDVQGSLVAVFRGVAKIQTGQSNWSDTVTELSCSFIWDITVSFHFGYLSVIVVLILEADGIVVLILSDCLLVVEVKRLVEASWWELPLCLLFGLRQPSPKVCRLL